MLTNMIYYLFRWPQESTCGREFFVCDWPGCTRSYTQNSHLVWIYILFIVISMNYIWMTFTEKNINWFIWKRNHLHVIGPDVTIGLSAPVMSLTIRSLTPERNDLFANSLNVEKGSPEAIIWRYGSNKWVLILIFNDFFRDTKRPLIQMSSKKKKSNKYWFDDWIKLWIKLI